MNDITAEQIYMHNARDAREKINDLEAKIADLERRVIRLEQKQTKGE